MNIRLTISASVLLLALGACGRGEDAVSGVTPGAKPTANVVDRGYIDRLLASTRVDYSQCDRSATLTNASAGGLASQSGPAEVLVAVDSSGSMAARSGAGTKMDEARAAVTGFMAALPPTTRGGLAAFGDTGSNRPEAKAASCQAPLHVLAAPGPLDRQLIASAAAGLRPVGWTPLASAITAGVASLQGSGRRLLYVVSDGVETCGGDPVAAAAAAKTKSQVVVNVIGFGIRSAAEEQALRAVAAAGGGEYRSAQEGRLAAAMRDQALMVEANKAINANYRATSAAQLDGGQCYLSHMSAQSNATYARAKADMNAGRISAATLNAVTKAQNDRYAQASELLRRNAAAMANARDARGSDIGSALSNTLQDGAHR